MTTERQLFEDATYNEDGMTAWEVWQASAAVDRTSKTEQQVIAEFLERTGQYVTNDATREAAIAEAVAYWKGKAQALDAAATLAPCQTEREQFEAWAASQDGLRDKLQRQPWPHDGLYCWSSAEWAWSMWQVFERRAQAAPQGPALVQQMLEVMESATSFTSMKARDEHPNVVAAARKWLAAHGITGATND